MGSKSLVREGGPWGSDLQPTYEFGHCLTKILQQFSPAGVKQLTFHETTSFFIIKTQTKKNAARKRFPFSNTHHPIHVRAGGTVSRPWGRSALSEQVTRGVKIQLRKTAWTRGVDQSCQIKLTGGVIIMECRVYIWDPLKEPFKGVFKELSRAH